jgi:hypothetical protein
MLYKLEIEIHETCELWEVEIDVEIKLCENEGETWHEVKGYKLIQNQKLPKVPSINEIIRDAFDKEVSNILNYYYDNLF